MRSADRAAALALGAIGLLPALAAAHERWVPNAPRFPINRLYFQQMSGEVLLFSIGATIAVFGVVVLWYLFAPGIVDSLTPVTAAGKEREARRNIVARAFRWFARFALDGELEGRFMPVGLRVATFVFGRIPAFVLGLGAYQGWLVMPSFPVGDDQLGLALRIASCVLAVWVLSGIFWRALGVVMLAVFVYLCVAYGIAAIDAIPVLASAFFYLFAPRARGAGVTGRQLLGMRLSLGIGFFLLGLINKIFLAELFIGVGDQHPDIVAGPQALFPALTREAWSFTTALGEMVFGLLMLFGAFNRVTTLILAFIFANFIAVFGLAEIVHVYPIAGFLLLFFRGGRGTSLDGIVFRANVRFWRRLRHSSSTLVFGGAVGTVASVAAGLLIFVPLVLVTEVVPVLAGTGVPRGYKPPPLPPPAAKWGPPPPPGAKPHADHEPRHAGVVTMVGDVHVEIVVRRDGGIRLWLSDDVRRPIAPRDARGSIKIERTGFSRQLPLEADPAGALAASGPAPIVPALYTYVLQIRGVPASTSLNVPAGGTDAIATKTPRPPR